MREKPAVTVAVNESADACPDASLPEIDSKLAAYSNAVPAERASLD